jgi:hypothetical protein
MYTENPTRPTARPASARAVLADADELKCPCSRRVTMMGRDRMTMATDDGTVRIRIHLTPDVTQSRKPAASAARTLRTSSGTNVVAMEMARRPWGRRKNV